MFTKFATNRHIESAASRMTRSAEGDIGVCFGIKFDPVSGVIDVHFCPLMFWQIVRCEAADEVGDEAGGYATAPPQIKIWIAPCGPCNRSADQRPSRRRGFSQPSQLLKDCNYSDVDGARPVPTTLFHLSSAWT